jgi:putative ATP-dependent endonuclease of OLD family
MRLTHVLIQNFRGIARMDLPLDRLTVVIGENNHGKSSLLDVLERCLGSPGIPTPTDFEPTDFRRTSAPHPEPIRVVLTFERDEDAARGASPHSVFDMAMTTDPDGVQRLHAEFTGEPRTGAMEARFLNAEGEALEPAPHPVVLAKLRRLHPVLVVRLAQPHGPDALEWDRPEDPGRQDADSDRDSRDEEDIARVYRLLAHARGPVPSDEVRRALLAIQRIRHTFADRYVSGEGPLRGLLEPWVAVGTDGGGADASGRQGKHPARLPPHPGGGSHALGLLLVLGSLIDVRGEAVLPEDAHPLIAIEEPEVHLHPMMVASTWDVIENLRAQTLIVTNSGEFLAEVPLRFLRRLVRRDGRIDAHRLRERTLSPDSLRRVGYHIRAKRGSVLFARCWLLVEGETEFWLMRQLAHVLGYDLEAEGVRCVEFAQCGVEPLVRLANDLHIEWHLMADGDEAGAIYVQEARQHLPERHPKRHMTRLRGRTIEMELWSHGYEDLYRRVAGVPDEPDADSHGARARKPRLKAYHIVNRAIRRHSKPFLAVTVAEEAARRGPDAVPPSLRRVIEEAVKLARNAVDDGQGFGAERDYDPSTASNRPAG